MICSLPVLELVLISIVVVTAAPPLHTISQNNGQLNQQKEQEHGGGSKLELKAPLDGDAEVQLEHLKLNSNSNAAAATSATLSTTTLKPKLADLNLETPAVSDNSHPPPPDSAKLFTFSKLIEFDKKKDVHHSPMAQRFSNNLKIETDYTAQDIAEYIFWTGDERGVLNALNDFLNEDLVEKVDVDKFLRDVKNELRLLANRFDSVVSHSRQNQEQFLKNQKFDGQEKGNMFDSLKSEKWVEKRIHDLVKPTKEEEADYEEVVQNMNAMNMKLREDSLREIIYRLAKDVFSQRFGDNSIQRFVHFVEDATLSGHIPKDLEKQILDTLVSALVDSMFEDWHHGSTESRANQLELTQRPD